MAKIKTRIVTGIDNVGDFYARAEVFRGLFQGWSKIETYWSIKVAEPDYAINMAKVAIDRYLLAASGAGVIIYPEGQ